MFELVSQSVSQSIYLVSAKDNFFSEMREADMKSLIGDNHQLAAFCLH